MRKVKAKYDLNVLLRIANVIVCGVCIYLYNICEDNSLVDIITLILVSLFAVENIGMLVYEKRKRNPFIIILVIVMTVFYMVRIATILHMPASVSPFGFSFIPSVTALNDTLIFILLSNAAMFSGIYFSDKYYENQKKKVGQADDFPQIKNAVIIIALVVLICFCDVLNFASLGRLTGFIQTFLNRNTIMLFTFTMLSYHYDRISPRNRILFTAAIIAMVILTTLSGSRSGILTVGVAILMGILAVKKRIVFNKKIVFAGLLIVPLSIVLFAAATLKQNLAIKDKLSIQYLLEDSETNKFDLELVNRYLPQLYYRMGFLDYSTELIANRQKFAQIINGQYYVKSIIDNVLSPGFDVFGTQRTSNSMTYIRNEKPIPCRDQIEKFYHTDQMGIYGDNYVFFDGYPALIVFFFAGFMFQFVFNTLKSGNALKTCIYRAVLLNIFYIWLNSFGMDWFIFDLIIAIITTFIFARYYVSNRKRKIVFRIEPRKKPIGPHSVA